MNTPHETALAISQPGNQQVMTLALSLAQAESAIEEFAAGQVDAIVDPDGRAYLLRPAQEHLRQEVNRLRTILDSTADGIIVLNRAGRIVSQNRAAARMLGYEPDELVGLNCFELVAASELNQFHSAFFNVIEDFRADALVEFFVRARDGSHRQIEATVSRLRDAAVPSVVLTCRDRTAHSAQGSTTFREAALAASLLDRDRFLAVLSHELRTPLSPVLLGIDELLAHECSPEAKATLATIRRNLDLQSRLLDDLMDFTALDQHKVRLRLELIDVHEAIRLVLETCHREIAAAQIEVLLFLPAAESVVLADTLRLQQVMWNLIRNAVKYSAPGGRISIATANDSAGRLVIEFADHGIGIDPNLVPLVFNSFQQGDLAGAQRNDGLGLGLYIAKGMAEAQGGTLTVRSEGRGKGASFHLTFTTRSQGLADSQRLPSV